MRQQKLSITLFIIALLFTVKVDAQLNLEGEFRVRWYGDSFSDALDNRGPENYMRYNAVIRGRSKLGEQAAFYTTLVAISDNPTAPTRNIAGTGTMRYGISEIFAEINQPGLFGFDIVRLRVGRQQFPIGNGLSFGESYNPNKFDGGRIDIAKDIFTLSVMGAITGQNLSASGLYPEPGSDQVYVARLGADIFNQDVMGYYIMQKPRGEFNDSYIIGGGAAGTAFIDKLDYFAEVGYQKFNVAPGLAKKHGLGYMGGIGYQWSIGPFKSVKLETRYAAFQGDDASTATYEQFSPQYTSFFWGAKAGYADGDIGGDFPHNNQLLEGSRIWFSRFWVIPKTMPKVRIQIQYTKVDEYINNDGINFLDDEIAARIYYQFSTQVQLQFRYSKTFPNDGDYDFDGGGVISSSEDRLSSTTFMGEILLKF